MHSLEIYKPIFLQNGWTTMTNRPLGNRIEHKYTRPTLIVSFGIDNVNLKLRSAKINNGRGEWGMDERVKGCEWGCCCCCL